VKAIWLLAATLPAYGQVLRLSTATVEHGSSGSLRLTSESPKGKEPAALQWVITLPSYGKIKNPRWTAGASAQGSGKTLQCGETRNAQPSSKSLKCVLAGGLKVIPDGEVAVLEFDVASDARRGKVPVSLMDILGATPDAGKLTYRAEGGEITVK